MKVLLSRNVTYHPFGQRLFFDDTTYEFDPDCAQTTAILTAELYNGKAAKDDDGNWVHAPGPRQHNDEHEIAGFHVGLTLIGFDDWGKAMHAWTVITPTGVAFHGEGKENALHTPSNWLDERVALEIISWVCLDEDSGATLLAQDDYQWTWVHSVNRENASAYIDELIEFSDRGESIERKEATMNNLENDVRESKEEAIEARAKDYQERLIHANQSGLVWYLLGKEDRVCWDDVANMHINVDNMDATDLENFLDDKMNYNWKTLVDINDYIFEDEDEPADPRDELANLNIRDLHEYDLEALRDYIDENYTPGEIFEWYLVDSWLASELETLGQATLTDGSNHWWGRRTTGQFIIMDGVLQQIAAKYI